MTPANDLRGSDSREYFASDLETPHGVYIEGITERMPDFEPASIQAEIDQIEAFANDRTNHDAYIESMTDASRYVAQVEALNAERREAAQNAAFVQLAHEVSEWLTFERDYEVADREDKRDWGLAA